MLIEMLSPIDRASYFCTNRSARTFDVRPKAAVSPRRSLGYTLPLTHLVIPDTIRSFSQMHDIVRFYPAVTNLTISCADPVLLVGLGMLATKLESFGVRCDAPLAAAALDSLRMFAGSLVACRALSVAAQPSVAALLVAAAPAVEALNLEILNGTLGDTLTVMVCERRRTPDCVSRIAHVTLHEVILHCESHVYNFALFVAAFPSIRVFRMHRCSLLYNTCESIDTALAHLARLRHLEAVELLHEQEWECGSPSSPTFAHFQRLQGLLLSKCTISHTPSSHP